MRRSRSPGCRISWLFVRAELAVSSVVFEVRSGVGCPLHGIVGALALFRACPSFLVRVCSVCFVLDRASLFGLNVVFRTAHFGFRPLGVWASAH